MERERLAAIRTALTETDQVSLVEQAHILTERQQRRTIPSCAGWTEEPYHRI
ncbi:MAG: hypothetical protein R3F36_00900 [Candidatus Competibacteraceae bacterium]